MLLDGRPWFIKFPGNIREQVNGMCYSNSAVSEEVVMGMKDIIPFREFIDGYISEKDDRAIRWGNFIDYVYREKGRLPWGYFSYEPDSWGDIRPEGRAFVASAVHKLCNDLSLEVPSWVMNPQYFLGHPYFAMNAKGKLRLVLLHESPKEFRLRNVYVSANALARV